MFIYLSKYEKVCDIIIIFVFPLRSKMKINKINITI